MRGRAVILLAVYILTGSPHAAPEPRAPQALAAMRQALGGEAVLGAVRSFHVSGRVKRYVGDLKSSLGVEIDCELPDKFVRRLKVRNPLLTVTNFDGFNGDEPIRETRPVMRPAQLKLAGPGAAAEIAASRKRMMLANKHAFAQLTLVLFATSFETYRLEFTDAGHELIQERITDIVSAKGPDDFTLRLYIDATSHMPAMMSWQGGWPAGEHRVRLGDFKVADGLNWPHRFQELVDGQMVEDMTLGRFKINPKIDPKKFTVAR